MDIKIAEITIDNFLQKGTTEGTVNITGISIIAHLNTGESGPLFGDKINIIPSVGRICFSQNLRSFGAYDVPASRVLEKITPTCYESLEVEISLEVIKKLVFADLGSLQKFVLLVEELTQNMEALLAK